MNMLKLYHERARATEDVSSVAAVTPVGHVRIDEQIAVLNELRD